MTKVREITNSVWENYLPVKTEIKGLKDIVEAVRLLYSSNFDNDLSQYPDITITQEQVEREAPGLRIYLQRKRGELHTTPRTIGARELAAKVISDRRKEHSEHVRALFVRGVVELIVPITATAIYLISRKMSWI